MRVLAVILIVLCLGVGYAGPPRLVLFGTHPNLTATRLAAPSPRRVGRLTWLGGARLTSHDSAFGSISALAVRPGAGANRFVLLSDGGNLTWFRLSPDWRVSAPRFGELPGGPRSGWEKRDRDSESLTLDATGRAWAGFESANEIWRYAPGFARAERAVQPRAMRRWDSNGGAETLLRLRDGRFLTLSETSCWPGQGGRAGILFAGDPTRRPRDGFGFSYLPAPGFDPVDAAELPNGDILVLERRWELPIRFRSRLTVLSRAALKPGARVRAREVGRIVPPWPTENYEGVAVTREGRVTVIWLVSDNDQSLWRPTYLLKLRLD